MKQSFNKDAARLEMRQVQQRLRFLEHQRRISPGEVQLKRDLRLQFDRLEKNVSKPESNADED